MNIALAILGYLLAAYFFAALAAPQIRIRWGYARSWIRSHSGKTKVRYRQPKLGSLTCLGTGIFSAAIATAFVAPDSAMKTVFPFVFIGGFLGVIGRTIDTGGGGWKKY